MLKEYLDRTGMERPKKLQRVSLFTMALRHGLHKAHAELRLREGEADPILAAELIDHRCFGRFPWEAPQCYPGWGIAEFRC